MKSSNCYSFNTIYRNSFNTTEEIINALGFLEAPEMLQFRMKLFIVTTVYFSDKSRFAIYLDCGRLRVWRITKTAIAKSRKCTIFVIASGGTNIAGRTELIWLEIRYWHQLSFHMQQRLSQTFFTCIVILQLTLQALQGNFWKTTILMGYPDLNSIKLLWNMLQRRVYRMERRRDNTRTLFLAVHDAHEISQQDID